MTIDGDRPPTTVTLRSLHQPVMGTHLELQITGPADAVEPARDAIVAEARRLESTFSVFDPDSDLCRWRSGIGDEPSSELAAVLVRAEHWRRRSRGCFHPAAGVLTDRWLQATADGVVPQSEELDALAAALAEPCFEVAGEPPLVQRTGPCDGIDLNALAKGHVVDLVAERALARFPIERLVINAGGDLLHRGDGTLRVAVEDPFAPYDNGTPLLRLEVRNAAVATSGSARRWFDVGGRRWSRVIDPRTGWPVTHAISATVIAADAADADALATVCSVLTPDQAVAFVDELADEATAAGRAVAPACLIVRTDGTQATSAGWPTPVGAPGSAVA